MRTIQEIQAEIIKAKEAEPRLSELNSTSKTAIWRLWTYIIATAIWTLETMFDRHKIETDAKIETMKPHKLLWYHGKVLNFQYGFSLIQDTDLYDNTNVADDVISNSRIIKYCAVSESSSGKLILKVAKTNHAALTENEYNSLKSYLAKIKDAGVVINLISYQSDKLFIDLHILYDATVFNNLGENLLTGEKEIETALESYLNTLPFNGEFSIMKLIDALQNVKGVVIPTVNSIRVENPEVVSKIIYNKLIPYSGHFKVEQLNITYEADI